MKLVLDFTHPKLPKWFWFVLVIACLLVIVRQMPVSWVSGSLASQTACRVMLQQPVGTIWQGSAALAFSEPNATEGAVVTLCLLPNASIGPLAVSSFL